MNLEEGPLARSSFTVQVTRDQAGCVFFQLLGVGAFGTESNIILSEDEAGQLSEGLMITLEKVREQRAQIKAGGYL